MKILVTGANGQLGQALQFLISHLPKHELIATARTKSVVPILTWQHELLDISNVHQFKELLAAHQPDAVINAAAMTHVDNCEKHPEESAKLNHFAVKSMAQACADAGVYLCHVSTDFVFDGESKYAYREKDTPNPVNVYGKDKLAGEHAVLNQKGLDASVLRTIVVYGSSPYKSTNNMILWAANALANQEPINIVSDQFRSITYVDDLAKACLSAVEKNAQGLYHVSGPEGDSILNWIKRLAHKLNLETVSMSSVLSKQLNLAAKRPPKTYFDITKAREELNYQPISFEASLNEMFPDS